MKRELFRSVSLARMSSPDQLDQLLRVTTSKSWIALLAIGIILTTAVVWGFEGRLATKTDGKGVVVRAGNLLSVGTLASGQVMNVSVKTGDSIRAGELIAVVGQPSLAEKIRAAEAQLSDAEKERDRQSVVRTDGTKLEMESLNRQRGTIDQQIATLQQQIKDIGEQIPVHEELYAKGLVTKQQLLALRERRSGLENNIAQLRTQQVQLNSSEFKVENATRQSAVDYDSRIIELQRNLKLLRDELALNSNVYTPYSGQVIEIQVSAGSLVGPGTTILTIQPEEEEMEVVAYVSAMKAKEVKPGMTAEIIPSSVRVEEFGFIRGTVRSVAEYPSTDAAVMRVFQNNSLAQALTGGGPMNEVRVQLIKNPHTPSGYQWSSKNGAPVKITPATLCSVQIITREQPPITMVFPYVKSKLGVY